LVSPAPHPEIDILSQNDPTDHALAAIASILDQPDSRREAEKTAVEQKQVDPGPIDAEGYSRVGPGPMAAIRFKWTVRRESDGEYYVDETIGESSMPLVSGPFTRDAAIKFVDDRQSDAQGRFDLLKSEMTGQGAPATNITRKESGEI
jgi:hypothetical protein